MRTSGSFSPSAASDEAILAIAGLEKSFGPNKVLKGMDLLVRPGEVHALMGENGAGKSTLINIVTGGLKPDAGTVRLDGTDLAERSPAEIRKLGVGVVFQEFSLVPELMVCENLFLGREHRRFGCLAHGRMRQEAAAMFESIGFDIDPARLVSDLTRSQKQMVEIAKALMDDTRVLILDEPTASLTNSEADKLFALVLQLKSKGTGIVYVSHRMPEIAAVSDRVTVLRDGLNVGTGDIGEMDEATIIEKMTGRKIGAFYPEIRHSRGECRLDVRNLSVGAAAVSNASIKVHAGEIVGIAGLEGSGKSALIRAIFGLENITGGEVLLDGALYEGITPRSSLDRGMCYFPSDRVVEGLALSRSVRENMTITRFSVTRDGRAVRFLSDREEVAHAEMLAAQIALRPNAVETPVGQLSGGNRQKVLLARGLSADTRVFLFDEPSVGIDVGAKREVYDLIAALVAQGSAVVLVSSDLPEILNLCARTYVMNGGRITGEFAGEGMTESAVLTSFFAQGAPQLSEADN